MKYPGQKLTFGHNYFGHNACYTPLKICLRPVWRGNWISILSCAHINNPSHGPMFDKKFGGIAFKTNESKLRLLYSSAHQIIHSPFPDF